MISNWALLLAVLCTQAAAEKFLTSASWTVPPAVSSTYNRAGHAAVPVIGGDGFMMYGGYSSVATPITTASFAATDIYVFSMNTSVWSTVSFGPTVLKPAARAYHTWVLNDFAAYSLLYGGHLSSQTSSNEAWVFEHLIMEWFLASNAQANSPTVGQHSMVFDPVERKFIVHGGLNLKAPISPALVAGTFAMTVQLANQGTSRYSVTVTQLATSVATPTYAHSAVFISDGAGGDTAMITYGGHTTAVGTYPSTITLQMMVCAQGKWTACTWTTPAFAPSTNSTAGIPGRVAVETTWNPISRELLACSGLAAASTPATACLALYIPTTNVQDWTTVGTSWRAFSVAAYAGLQGGNNVMVPITRFDGTVILLRHGGAKFAVNTGANAFVTTNMDYTIMYQVTAAQ